MRGLSPHAAASVRERVVALPGDRVEMRDGQLLINGQVMKQSPIDTTDDAYVLDENLYGCAVEKNAAAVRPPHRCLHASNPLALTRHPPQVTAHEPNRFGAGTASGDRDTQRPIGSNT